MERSKNCVERFHENQAMVRQAAFHKIATDIERKSMGLINAIITATSHRSAPTRRAAAVV
jgi:hypothetical protein